MSEVLAREEYCKGVDVKEVSYQICDKDRTCQIKNLLKNIRVCKRESP